MAKNRSYKIALVGCGGMAARYRHKYTQIPGAKLAVLIDTNRDEAKKAAWELNVDKFSTDFNDCLIPEIDIVDISTPNQFHCEQSIKAMEAGKHIIVQKPIATTVEEAQKMVDTANTTGLRAGIYMNMLEYPIYHDIKDMADKEILGVISGIYCRGAGRKGKKSGDADWRSSIEKTGGGAFIQKTIHFINLSQWLLDQKIKSVMAFSKNLMSDNIGGDDITNAVCEFDGGIQGSFESSYISVPHIFAVFGSKGFVMVIAGTKIQIMLDEPYKGGVLDYDTPGVISSYCTDIDARSVFYGNNPYDQHVAFVNSVINDAQVPVGLDVGLYDLKVVKAVYASAKKGRRVNVVIQK